MPVRDAKGSPTCDRAFCRAILPRVSRTFALSIELLPTGLGDAVNVAYLLCRILDTIEDQEDLAPPRRRELFAQIDGAIDDRGIDLRPFEASVRDLGLGGTTADADLCARAASVFACYHDLPRQQREAIAPSVHTMGRGMRDFAETIHAAADDDAGDPQGPQGLEDLRELERYCYIVAGTVGELLDGLFADDLRRMSDTTAHATIADSPSKAQRRALAISFGLGLQLVNILKDAGQDFAAGRCFLPRQEAQSLGLDLGDLLNADARPKARSLVSLLAARARAHLDRAAQYTLSWPAEATHIRLFCAVPLLLARATLDEIDRGDDVLRPDRAPKISRQQVAQIVAAATRAVPKDDALAALLGPIDAAA